MKTKTFLVVSTLAAALQFAPVSYAEPGDGQNWGRHRGQGRFLANLSPDERQKLRAANQKVMADPAVQAAKDRQRQATRELRELKRAKMLQADPTLQPILDKIPARGGRDS